MKTILSTLLLIWTYLGFSQAVYTSNGNANWVTKSNWIILGTDGDGDSIPDSNDDVIINHTVTLTDTREAQSLIINSGGTFNWNGNLLTLYGNFTNSGNVSGQIKFYVRANSTITSASSLFFGINGGSVGLFQIFNCNVTISSGTSINLRTTSSGANSSGFLQIRNNAHLINNGNISTSNLGNGGVGATFNNRLTNNNNSQFTLSNTINLSSGNILITNQTGSEFFMNSSSAVNIPNCAYYNLTLQGIGVKSTTSNLTINNDFTISAGSLSLGTNNLTVTRNLTITGSISSTATLNIGGNIDFTGAGSMSGNNTFNLNGSSAQSFSTASSIPFYNLICNNSAGVTLSSGTYTLRNILTVSAGNLNAGSNLLTMLSDATSTAIIGNSPAGTISGSMIMQRYIQPLNIFRKFDLGSCVTSATIDDWDNELYMSIGAPNNVPGYPGGDGNALNKFGQTVRSVYRYNNQNLTPSTRYEAVLTGTTLQVGRGYQAVISDASLVSCSSNCFPGRTIDLRGTPNMGTISLPVMMGVTAQNLLANPFQAEIDWNLVTKNDVSPTVQIIQYSGTTLSYSPLTNPIINPGLGFVCFATGPSPSVSIPQSAKTNNTSSAFGLRLNSSAEDLVNLKLRISSTESSEYNEAELVFEKKSSTGFDFEKDHLFGENLVEDAPVIIFNDSGNLFIRNYFNDDLETAIFPLSISTPLIGIYSLDLEGLYNSNDYQDAYLINNLTKEKYSLTDNKSASIYFDKVENDHFQLVLSKKSSAEDIINSTSNYISIFATSENLVIKNLVNQIQQFELKVYNVLGQLLFEQSNVVSGKSELRIPTEFLKSDVYVVKLRTIEGNEITKKVVLTK
jgi:hypothetical protein